VKGDGAAGAVGLGAACREDASTETAFSARGAGFKEDRMPKNSANPLPSGRSTWTKLVASSGWRRPKAITKKARVSSRLCGWMVAVPWWRQ
jgi:hypothetical protein